jgi:pimeloyl-ACP methyl ester carboxylesterase
VEPLARFQRAPVDATRPKPNLARQPGLFAHPGFASRDLPRAPGTHDLPGLAQFWTQTLGWRILSERERTIVIEPGDRHRPAPPRDRWWLAIRKTRVISRASELRCPTLLIIGRHDPQTPVKISQAIHKRVPDSELEIFERSGHSPFLEEPERFTQVLSAFLQ